MKSDPVFDPFLEAGYHGYAVRAVAHRLPSGAFRPLLHIRDYRQGAGEIICERQIDESFASANGAIDRAMGYGQQMVDDLMAVLYGESYIEA